MKSVLITGCNRGIGLGLVKHLVALQSPPKNIFATCRNPNQAEDLQKIADQHKNVHIIQIDLRNIGDYDEIFNFVKDKVSRDGLNLLINSAGISSRFTRIGMVKSADLEEHFLINTIAPIMLTQKLVPLLKEASAKNGDHPAGISRAAIINISSVLGGISSNTDGGFYPYRTSKAALNAATKSLSLDLKSDKIIAMALHPGWLKTAMGGPNAPLTVDAAIPVMVEFLQKINETHNGGFYSYEGKQMPW